MKFVIDQRLPGLNDLINANRINRYQGAKLKKETDEIISLYILNALNNGFIKPIPIQGACIIHFDWCEKTKKRHVDNIQSSQKFILDALQKTKIIPNDSQRYVQQTSHKVHHTSSDYVIVTITEVCS